MRSICCCSAAGELGLRVQDLDHGGETGRVALQGLLLALDARRARGVRRDDSRQRALEVAPVVLDLQEDAPGQLVPLLHRRRAR